MTPNIVKGQNALPTDRSDHPNHPRNNPDFQPNRPGDDTEPNADSNSGLGTASKMDGDHAAKTMDAGANKATQGADFADAIHEDSNQKPGAGAKETGQGTSIFDAQQGAIGSAFHKDGVIGQLGEKVGGPLSSSGAIGKNFNPDGSIGGTFQKLAERNQEH